MLDPILKPLAWLLAFFYGLIPSGIAENQGLGIAIILVTFTIMLLLYPLTAKQARSMIAMQMVQPEIKRIQAKYKNDKAKLNEEMMAFYKENKINPLAGCLPLLIQMPIFFALFRVLRSPYKYVPTDSKLYDAFCTTKQGVVVGVNQCSGSAPKYSYLPTHQSFLGIDLSVSAPSQIGLWATFAAFAMVLAVMLTGYMQSRQAQKRTPAVNKQMAMITKVMPVFFGFISLRFPAGLVLYFFVSNAWRLGQQEVIFRKIGTAANPKHKSLMNPPKAGVVDAESRERGDTSVDVLDEPPALEAGEAPPKTTPAKSSGAKGSTAKSPTPKASTAKSSNGKAEAIPVAPPPRGGGGIRSLFRLPPPPGEAPKPGPPASKSKSVPAAKPASSTSGSGSSSSSGPRPGQTGRRTSKKKKKR